jgi:hypothetical protein
MMDGDYMLMYFDGLNKYERPYYLRGHVSKEKAQEVLAYEEEITVKSVEHKYGRSIRVSPDNEEAIDGCESIFRVIDTPRRSYSKVTECEPLLPFNAESNGRTSDPTRTPGYRAGTNAGD